jgi:hypothetical protein
MEELINTVKPEWIVQRPGEFEILTRQFPKTAALYEPAARFSTPKPPGWGGATAATLDGDFIVLRRRTRGRRAAAGAQAAWRSAARSRLSAPRRPP